MNIKKVYEWFIDKWLASLLTATIVFILNYYKDLPETEKKVFFHFTSIKTFLNSGIAVWQVALVLVFIVILHFLQIKKLKKEKSQPPKKKIPDDAPFLKYKSDKFGQERWSWDYEWSQYDEKYSLLHIAPNCPKCNTKMEYDAFGGVGTCFKCRIDGKQNTFKVNQLPNDIGKEIERRVHSNEFIDKVI